MRKTLKLTLSAALVAVALVGWSFRSAVAQNAAAKGKITVTVKAADGALGANVPVSLLKGNVPMPAGGGRRGGGGGGGGGGGAAPASQPAPLKTGTTDAKGVYTFADVDAGEYTVFAGAGGGGGRRNGGGGGGGGAAAGGAPTSAPGVRGRGAGTGMVKAGEELKLEITLMAGGRGGGGGQGGGGGGRRGGGAAGQ